MGRPKIHKTTKAKKEAAKAYRKRYYTKNQRKLTRLARERAARKRETAKFEHARATSVHPLASCLPSTANVLGLSLLVADDVPMDALAVALLRDADMCDTKPDDDDAAMQSQSLLWLQRVRVEDVEAVTGEIEQQTKRFEALIDIAASAMQLLFKRDPTESLVEHRALQSAKRRLTRRSTCATEFMLLAQSGGVELYEETMRRGGLEWQ